MELGTILIVESEQFTACTIAVLFFAEFDQAALLTTLAFVCYDATRMIHKCGKKSINVPLDLYITVYWYISMLELYNLLLI